jgi:cytochrome c biogenesis protein CcmG/thiol:disulfide interchange protein DsbE
MIDEMAREGPVAVQMIQQLKQMDKEDFIKENLGLIYDMMPDEPIGVGAVWHKVTSENIQFVGAAKISAEYELREIEQTPDGRIAHIIRISNIEQDQSKRTQFGSMSLSVAKLDMKGKGEIQLNMETGLMISGRMEMAGEMEMSMFIRGKNVASNHQMNKTTEITARPIIGNGESKRIAPLEPLARQESRVPTVSKTESPLIGKPAPSFTLRNLSGKRVSLSDFKGKVIILDFWATWCPPCVVEIPHFIALYKQYKDKGFAMVGISTDRKGARTVRSFALKNRINYPILMADGRVQAAYGGIRAIPTTFVIDSAGIIRHQYIGYRDKSVFETAIKALLADAEPQ